MNAPSPRVTHVDANGASLEVVDWGGSGPPLVLLAGLGNTAHIFDDFAPTLTDTAHVWGITRRGFGASSTPDTGYDTATLGADVLAVLDALTLERPILAGHSLGGEELTWIAGHHGDRIRGVAYLDAAFDRVELFAAFGMTAQTTSAPEPPPPDHAQASPAALARHLTETQQMPVPLGEVLARYEFDADNRFVKSNARAHVTGRIIDGVVRPSYSNIKVPTLALFVVYDDPALPIAVLSTAAREAFTKGVPHAKVVELRNAHHYHMLTNADETARELRTFVASVG